MQTPAAHCDDTRRRGVLDAGVLLSHVEESYAGRTGAVLVGPPDEPDGTLFLERGRLCWAVASGMRTRLSDLLRADASPPLSAETLEGVYQRCRRERRPLGEMLVDGGFVTPDALRRALLHHTAEAVVLLTERDCRGERWVEHRGAAYDARFTFSAAEIWCAGGAMLDAGLAASALGELETVVEAPSRGVSALVHGSEVLLLAQCGEPPLSIAETLQFATWAGEATATIAAMQPGRSLLFTTASDDREGGVVAWRDGSVVHGAVCPDRSSLYVTTVRHARRRAAHPPQRP